MEPTSAGSRFITAEAAAYPERLNLYLAEKLVGAIKRQRAFSKGEEHTPPMVPSLVWLNRLKTPRGDSRAVREAGNREALGGMCDPFRAVQGCPGLRDLGREVHRLANM